MPSELAFDCAWPFPGLKHAQRPSLLVAAVALLHASYRQSPASLRCWPRRQTRCCPRPAHAAVCSAWPCPPASSWSLFSPSSPGRARHGCPPFPRALPMLRCVFRPNGPARAILCLEANCCLQDRDRRPCSHWHRRHHPSALQAPQDRPQRSHLLLH